MTEADWDTCTSPEAMLAFLRGTGKASDRKLRLFAVACCRRFFRWTSEAFQGQLDVAERYADGRATRGELKSVRQAAARVAFQIRANNYDRDFLGNIYEAEAVAAAAALPWPWWLPFTRHYAAVAASAAAATASLCGGGSGEPEAQAGLLRDIVGNPFRPAALDPAWRTPQVVALAQAIYDERAFERLTDLADLLEKAGCHDADLLGHLRGPGPHTRGCWVCDLLLKKA
jgi:hypothetical protein